MAKKVVKKQNETDPQSQQQVAPLDSAKVLYDALGGLSLQRNEHRIVDLHHQNVVNSLTSVEKLKEEIESLKKEIEEYKFILEDNGIVVEDNDDLVEEVVEEEVVEEPTKKVIKRKK